MSTYTEEIGDKLNELLEKNYDAEKGFSKAAEKTQHGGLKSYFQRKAQERNTFGHELKTEIRQYGQDPEKGDSFVSKAHRAWMDVKALFASDNEEAMLEEAIRGEKAAVSEYEDVLNDTNLPPSTQQLLTQHKVKIQSGLETIKRLEDLN